MSTPPVEDLFAVLVGRWSGEGRGEYPTIEPFEYLEEVTYTSDGRPFLTYAQRTSRKLGGNPLHAETGYWRKIPSGELELVLAHSTGIIEVARGTEQGSQVDFESQSVGLSRTAKEVTSIRRHLEIDAEVLRYSIHIAAVGQPLTLHLTGELRRSE